MLKTNPTSFDLVSAHGDGGDGGAEAAAMSGSPVGDVSGVTAEMSAAVAAAAAGATAQFFVPRPILAEAAIQQHVLQLRQQQLLQRHILEQQFLRNREILEVEHERQLASILHQQQQIQSLMEAQAAQTARANDRDRQEKLRLELLRQKTQTEQSAVASPEVKRHLQEFVLQKKRKEAAGSMGNLKAVPVAPPPPQPLLRKTASESNLLKMKNKRCAAAAAAAAPYQRHAMHPAIPEGAEGTTLAAEASSTSSSPPIDLGSPSSLPQELMARGSAPTSPKTPQDQSPPARNSAVEAVLRAQQAALNSKSLPNIPTAVSRLSSKEAALLHKRRSPPPGTGCARQAPHHGAMIVRRSKSSAILPLRKHLIEKSLQESNAKKALEEELLARQQHIKPIEEVLEEESKPSESMDVDELEQPSHGGHRQAHSFTARLGPSGLSPLVLSEVRADYLSKLLPRHPVDMMGMATAATTERTGLGYDPQMLLHRCSCQNDAFHPENPLRLLAVWERLVATGLAGACVQVARKATLEEIKSHHSEDYTLMYGMDAAQRGSMGEGQKKPKFCQLSCGGTGIDADTYWNELETPAALRTAVGTLIELSQKVLRGDLRNGFALIRPPSHHAEYEEAMGFCYFNAVAIAAKQLQLLPAVRRILVIDWAIHHGNGTQKAFYDNPNVLYISLHRHDNGNFYPGTGSSVECGTGPGIGFNINIAWSGGLEPPMGDAEYLAAFRSIIMPVAKSFDPDLVLVSAGFDAAVGHPHPIGGYTVSTACFAYMTLQLRQLAAGRLVLALEGGFNLPVLCDAAEQCVRALVGMPIDKIEEDELARRPCAAAVETLQKTLAIQSPYWSVLKKNPNLALLSHLEAWERSREDTETLNAMASLTVETAADAIRPIAFCALPEAPAVAVGVQVRNHHILQPSKLCLVSAEDIGNIGNPPPAHLFSASSSITAIDLSR